MRGRSGTISVLLLRPHVAALAPVPGGLEAFFAATDLTPELLADVDARVSPAQFCVAWSELARQTRDPHVALHLAEAIPAGAFGIVEYVCRSAPTLGDALERWVRYLNLLDDALEVGLVPEGERVSLRVLTESEAPAPLAHELCFAMLVLQARRFSTLPFRPLAIELSHRAPPDAAVYARWFDAPVRFRAEHTQLVMTAAALATPLATSDPQLLGILTRHADELTARDADRQPLTGALKRVLRESLRQNEGHVDVAARRLGLTARSLQRRLKEEGTAFQTVREEVRRELASRYLADDLSIAEISFLLGFSEPSAFFRAFKRWTGVTPIEDRQRRRAAAES